MSFKGHSYNPEGCPKCGKVHVVHSFRGKRGKPNKNRGRPLTSEHAKNIGHALEGRCFTKEWLENLSKAHKETPFCHPPDCTCGICKAIRGEMFGEGNPFYGKHHTSETISVLSEKACAKLQSGCGKVQGHFYSIKNKKELPFRSSWELAFMKSLEEDIKVASYAYEPFRIPYFNTENLQKFTVPDFLVSFDDGTNTLVEIRPAFRLKDLNTLRGMEAMKSFCEKRGFRFLWIQDVDKNGKFETANLV